MSKFSGKYELDKVGWIGGWWGKPKFEFTNSIQDPLTYDDGDIMVRPDNHFYTDKGSVPRIFQTILPIWFDRARFERAYIFHDSAFLHGGAWVATKGGDFMFIEMTMKQANRYLYDMVIAEGGSKGAARAIYSGVQMFGRFSWKRKIPHAYQDDAK